MKCYLENITSCLGLGSAESQSLAQSFLRSCSFSLRSLCLDSITLCRPALQTSLGAALPPPKDALEMKHCSEQQTWGKKG